MKFLKNISFALLLILCQHAFSGAGLLFDVSASGSPGSIDMILCLNAKGPLSCQHYHVSALALSIRTTTPNHTYPTAGIKITTPGYTVGNLGVDCTPNPSTGYCMFSVSDTTPKTFYVVTANGSLSISSSGSSTLPTATSGTPYSAAITVSGGVPPYTYTISSGQLPPGLTLDPSTGVISGTPTGNGPYNFTITVTDSNQPTPHTGSQTFSLTVLGLTLNPQALPDAPRDTPYSQTVIASGGVAPYTYAVSSGSLPSGLSLNPLTGVISGTPTTDSTYPFTITARDSNGKTGAQAYTIRVSGPLVLMPTTLPDVTLNASYNQTVVASGGVAPYSYTVTSGSLPAGLSLNASTGVISGIARTDSTYTFTITATDSNSPADMGSQAYTIVVSGPLPLTPPSLPAAALNSPYSQTVVASGGVAPYTYTVTSGSLPSGLSLNASTGVISGTPTTDSTYTFTITATDSNLPTANTGSQAYTIVVSGPLPLSPASLPAATLNSPYSQTVTASGGVTPYSYAVTSGSLPAGLSLNASTGVISGTPTTDSTYTFTITATDSRVPTADTGSKAYTIVVSGPLPLLPASLPAAVIDTSYTQTITASDGVPPYTYAVTSGSLPPGLTLNSSTGVISGTPTVASTYTFTITATDSNSPADTGSQAYTIIVNPIAYVVNNSNNTVSVCPVNTGGLLGTCIADPDATFARPYALALNAANTFAYVTNANTSTVSVCPINLGGSLSVCSASNPGGTFNGPNGIVLNPGNTLVYVTNTFTNTVSVCSINPNGSLGSCNASNPGGFNHPTNIVLNTTNTLAYIVNDGSSTVSICAINPVDGSLSSCTSSDPGSTFSSPLGITLNAANTLAYVTNSNNTVSICSINPADGSLVSCTPSDPGSTFNGPNGIALNPTNTWAYVANFSNSTVSVCPIITGGALGACSIISGDTLTGPTGITIM